MSINPKSLTYLSPFEIRRILFGLAEEGFQECLDRNEPAKILNAGRGNPNFLNTTAREAFNHICAFATELARTDKNIGFRPEKEGIGKKFQDYLEKQEGEGIQFLKKALRYTQDPLNLILDEVVFEWADGALGDYYPVPPRIFRNTEIIVNRYLADILKPPRQPFHLFATEGATAAITYLFKSLKINYLLRPGDQIAVITPVYSPYLEIPLLEAYGLRIVPIQCKKELDWQIPDEELEKLKDRNIKALFLVNPGNPTAIGLERETLRKVAQIIRTQRQDLLALTDAVYATFAETYWGLIQEVPENTILIYSYSKYFGATGWRLGVVMMADNHVADRLIANLSAEEQATVSKRYGLVSPTPENIPFIERLALDSREIALSHTGGLSGPQQVMMGLLSLYHLLDENRDYQKKLHRRLSERMELFYQGLGVKPPRHKNQTHYYALIGLAELAHELYGGEFSEMLVRNHSLLDFLCRLAKERLTIALPGEGFGAPPWTLRISLANLRDEEYTLVGKNIRETLKSFISG